MASGNENRTVNLHSLLKSGKFSDLKLSCGGHDFAVHKAVLCAQSRVFSAECEGGFEESRTNVIKIEEFEVNTVQRMLDFLYSGDYCVTQGTDSNNLETVQTDGVSSKDENETMTRDSKESDGKKIVTAYKDILRRHLSANAIGDYYDIQPLCELSRSKLKTAINGCWSTLEFLHLFTETCTTRKTGDPKFHQLIGHTIGEHLEDLAGVQGLDVLEVPGAVLTSIITSSTERLNSVQQKVLTHETTIESLRQSKSTVDTQMSWVHKVHDKLSQQSECLNANCKEKFGCYIIKYSVYHEGGYSLRCSKCNRSQ